MTIQELRQSARRIWEAALSAANPAACIGKFLHLDNDLLTIGGRKSPLRGRLIVVGTGKASARMAQAVEQLLGGRITGGLVVTKFDHSLPTDRVRVVEAGHPIPDSAGTRAVAEMRELLHGLSPDDVVLCLISGGGSALWPAPAEGMTLEQKQEVTHLLLRAGATIRELNAVRKHMSSIKGGQLARWASPARVVSLIMSDVIGDPLDFIASGPTAPDTTSFSDALAIIHKYEVHVPSAVLERLQQGARGGIPDTP
jgi:hydroxypyruvate reductase